MSKTMKFSKWQGLGNDFIIIDDRDNKYRLMEKQISFLCHRNFGIGCDQLMVVRKSRKADFRMELYNQDGGRAEMSGNGIRCFAMYITGKRLSRKKELEIETDAGIIRPKIKGEVVAVDMGEPILQGRQIPMHRDGQVVNAPLETDNGIFNITAVSMGNPHVVIFVSDVEKVNLEKHGPALENHPVFPNRSNVEFAQIVARDRIKLRVWERGAGPTLACGTGACATVVAGVLNGLTKRKVTVSLPGGRLDINWDEETNRVFMTGPAVEVFNGVTTVRNL